MPLKRVQEPETLAGIVEASYRDRSPTRRSAYEEKLKDVDSELLLKKLAEFVIVEQNGARQSFAWSLGLHIGLTVIILLILLIGLIRKWDVSGMFFVFAIGPGSFLELFQLRRKAGVSNACKRVIQLTRKLKSGTCVGPLLDILENGVDSAQQQTELLECLRIPLSRVDTLQAAQLSQNQLKTLEKLVISEPNDQVTLNGLLVLGSAGYRVTEWNTVLSWARTPTRHGAAAREYLVSVGGMVR